MESLGMGMCASSHVPRKCPARICPQLIAGYRITYNPTTAAITVLNLGCERMAQARRQDVTAKSAVTPKWALRITATGEAVRMYNKTDPSCVRHAFYTAPSSLHSLRLGLMLGISARGKGASQSCTPSWLYFCICCCSFLSSSLLSLRRCRHLSAMQTIS